MTAIRSYRDLLVWQKGIALVTEIYGATKRFPQEELYGLISQTRRCAVSNPSNIAEGHDRSTRKADVRYLEIAVGSLFELQTQLVIARNLNYLQHDAFNSLDDRSRELERILTGLIRSLRRKPSS